MTSSTSDEPLYDATIARTFVAAFTQLAPELVDQVLDAQERYQGAIGILPREYFPVEVDLNAERAKAPELFPVQNQRELPTLDWSLEAEFICRRTGVARESVLRILIGESAYAVSIGVLDAEALVAHRVHFAHELGMALTS